MFNRNWSDVAAVLAENAHHFTLHRGALLMECPGDQTMIAGVFGNDDYASDDKAKQEVDQLRRRLSDASVEELGFGVSRSGHTWAVFIRPSCRRFQTNLGKAFHSEMFKVALDEVLLES